MKNSKLKMVVVALLLMVSVLTSCAYPPAPATQTAVNAGTEPYLYVTPLTLAGWTGAGVGNTNALTPTQSAKLNAAVTNNYQSAAGGGVGLIVNDDGGFTVTSSARTAEFYAGLNAHGFTGMSLYNVAGLMSDHGLIQSDGSGNLLATSLKGTNILWPDGGLLVHLAVSTGLDEILYQNQNTFWDQNNIYFPDGTAAISLQTKTFSGLFDGGGTGITSLNAGSLAIGTVPTARLGTGPANSSTFLRGDNTWATPSGGGSGITSGLINGTSQTNVTWGGVITIQGYPGFENPSNSVQLVGSRGANIGYAAPYFRPTYPNSQLAIDGMPNGLAVDNGNGIVRFDLCNSDLSANSNGQVTTASLVIHSTYGEVGSFVFNGGTNFPFQITDYGQNMIAAAAANRVTIGPNSDYQFNIGFVGAGEIPAGSLLNTPAGKNLALLAGGTQLAINYNSADSTYHYALNVSNSLPGGFSQLWLMQDGGATVVGGGLASMATNATLIVTTTGITNTSGINYEIKGFTGTSVTQTNPSTGYGFSRGTITTPTDILLQLGEKLNGSSCAAEGGHAF